MRLIAVALLAGTSLALAACGSSADESDEPSAAATEALTAGLETPAATGSASPSPTASASASPTPSPTPSAKATTAAAAAPVTAPAAFNQCKACHSVEPGKHGIGPSLAGIYGTKAAAVPGYEFSDAMKASGLTWNAATLDRYLENPRTVVPGTTMGFGGLKDAAKRKEVVDYIKSL